MKTPPSNRFIVRLATRKEFGRSLRYDSQGEWLVMIKDLRNGSCVE
ncbi:MAG: hypothetical protein M1371_04035 [Actinobacteria bacterium]|nr:hypothetical protein [Actinomycetota bacterium]